MGAEQIVEMGAGRDGRLKEIEFHVPYATLPEAVRTALETLVPGGEVLDAEVEIVGARRLYEVTKRIDGREVEVLVDAAGRPVEWESEIDPAAAPPAVLASARAAVPGNVTAVEEIRDPARTLLAYHIKIDDAGKRYKLALSPSGAVREVRREMRAEIEVLVR
jgi:uncharacterized membrane protein YkoI